VEQDPLRQVPDAAPTPERLTQSVELRRQMQNALQSLTPAERIAFVMRHCDGCGIEEIAAALKSNSGAAKNTVFRAVHKLREILEPQFAPRATARAMGTES
jgi:RNA polymerase sigma-70 factor, ECF subfamily